MSAQATESGLLFCRLVHAYGAVLSLYHFGVGSVLGQQLTVRSRFDDRTGVVSFRRLSRFELITTDYRLCLAAS